MFRIALVEDDAIYMAGLKEYLRRFEKEYSEPISVSTFPDGEDIVTDYQGDYDLIIMDVEMQFMDGMTAAGKIRELDSEVTIIFITNMPQYAIEGYKVGALDYILKPISYFAFSQKLERVIGRVRKKERAFLSITLKGGVAKVEISQILYVEVQDHDLIFHTIDGKYQTKGSISELEKTLGEKNFFRCNRCYLVNLEYVESFIDGTAMVGKDAVLVSRGRKKGFLNALNSYMNEVGK